ncbi:hypothetical protein K5I29_10525 [Flavobacterium agricola]|uniref:Uncharacterized protein n=1 Tax=Flavobacterium agricola TaxID=2870839 RepID=A0ABY6LXH1_9FLAO|nr:hypothetical protein [Flavobacterium agricola]UYW00929.1 hypothetical protein K5I29_10525 [Flavobacterium agricola]
MLTNKKDESEQRINALLQRLSGITFIPENFNEALFWTTLEEAGFSKQVVLDADENAFFQQFLTLKWPWEQIESFADILVALEKNTPNKLLKERAKHLYQFILDESKLFSMTIVSKMDKL